MAGRKIPGITLEIDADASKFNKQMAELSRQGKSTSSELAKINKALKYDPHNVELVTQKHELLKEQISRTEEQLVALKAAQAGFTDEMKSTDEGAAKYRALTREISKVEGALASLQAQYDSTTRLSRNLADITDEAKGVTDELHEVQEALKINPGNLDLLKQKHELLTEAVGDTQYKLELLQKQQARLKFDETDEGKKAYRELTREIISTQDELEELSGQLGGKFQPYLEAAGTKIKKFTNGVGQAGEAMKSAGSTLTKGLTVPLLGVASAAMSTVPATEEFRDTLSKLEQNTKKAGKNFDQMKEHLQDISVLTGETDSAVEGLSNLLMTGFDDAGMQTAIDNLAGAVISFPDTLKFESLSDSLQETIATGAATGQFSELLGRMGVNVEEFNLQLEGCTTASERQNVALQALAGTGLSGVYEEYQKTNKESLAYKDAQYDLNEALSELAETLAPIITDVTNFVTSLIEWWNDLSPAAQSMIEIIGIVIGLAGPILTFIGSLCAILPVLTATQTAYNVSLWACPVTWIVAAIIVLIGVIALLVLNWDSVTAAVGNVWDKIKAFCSTVGDVIVSAFQAIWDFLKACWDGIVNIIKTAIDVVVTIIQGAWDIVKFCWGTAIGFFQAIWDGILAGVNALISFIKSGFQAAYDFVTGAWEKVKGFFSGLWDFIKQGINDPIGTIKNAFSGVVDFIKGIFNFDIKWPKIPMPHFSIKPRGWSAGDLLKGKIPSLGIDFYAKGGILTAPTLFGLNGSRLMVGGEAGQEAVLPLDEFYDNLRDILTHSQRPLVVNMEVNGTADAEETAELAVEKLQEALRKEQDTWS